MYTPNIGLIRMKNRQYQPLPKSLLLPTSQSRTPRQFGNIYSDPCYVAETSNNVTPVNTETFGPPWVP